MSNKICLFSTINDCTFSPEDNNFRVSISDINGYSIFDDDITIGKCAAIERLQQQLSFCPPFRVRLMSGNGNTFLSPQGLSYLIQTYNIILTLNSSYYSDCTNNYCRLFQIK